MTSAHRKTFRVAVLVLLASLGSTGCAVWQGIVDATLPRGAVAGRVERSERTGGVDSELVLVTLEASPSRSRRRSGSGGGEVVIRDGRQEPEIRIVAPGEAVTVRNLDPIYHDLFTAEADHAFDVRLKGGETSPPIQLEAPGFVRGFCRLHPNESFAFFVAPADRVVPLDGTARFEIDDLAPGEYRVRAVSADGESPATSVRVTADETARLTLRLYPRSRR